MSIKLLREILINRRSIRKWKQDAVPRALVEDVIALATLAPSGNNQQNWSFIAVLNKELIQQMAKSVLTKAKAIVVEGMGTPWENQLFIDSHVTMEFGNVTIDLPAKIVLAFPHPDQCVGDPNFRECL